jgi:hypothetical protein
VAELTQDLVADYTRFIAACTVRYDLCRLRLAIVVPEIPKFIIAAALDEGIDVVDCGAFRHL